MKTLNITLATALLVNIGAIIFMGTAEAGPRPRTADVTPPVAEQRIQIVESDILEGERLLRDVAEVMLDVNSDVAGISIP